MRTTKEIIKEMQELGRLRDQHNETYNEGAIDGFNPHEERLAKLSEEFDAARQAESPLTNNLAGEREWFNSQGFTGAELKKANAACKVRGYSLAELQSAAKASGKK